MALKALLPIGIMATALGTAGVFSGGVGKKRQYHEHSRDWETGLKEVYGVIPPRTRIDPYIAPLHPALVDRKIPIYHSGALLSQIVPGGPLDPYANPLPTRAQELEERKRLDALVGIKLDDEALDKQMGLEAAYRAENAALQKQHGAARQAELVNLYRNAPMAEFYRIQAYQKLHPELTVDEDKIKTLNQKRMFMY